MAGFCLRRADVALGFVDGQGGVSTGGFAVELERGNQGFMAGDQRGFDGLNAAALSGCADG